MASPSSKGLVSHITDVSKNQQHLAYFGGISDWETLPLLEAVRDLPVDRIKRYAKASQRFAQSITTTKPDPHGLTLDEIASLNLYTSQWSSGESLYVALNRVLRSENRGFLKRWFPYLKLVISALRKLPRFCGNVWRGVNMNLVDTHPMDLEFTWYVGIL